MTQLAGAEIEVIEYRVHLLERVFGVDVGEKAAHDVLGLLANRSLTTLSGRIEGIIVAGHELVIGSLVGPE